MGLKVGDLYAQLAIDAGPFDRSLGKIDRDVDATGRRFAGIGRGVALGLAGLGAGALAGLAKTLKSGLGEVMDASAGQAQLAAGIKSTGNAANVTIEGLNRLASSIQNYSGQTDDSIRQTEALLLTFTHIRNVGADRIFDQAVRAAADMAAKMGGDASGAAIQLGKALNDPIKGMTALQRVGVSFTAAQKAQISAMAESGDIMGAQKLILKELQKEFGGAAKAAGESIPGQLERAKRAFEDFAEGAVVKLAPLITKAIEVARRAIGGLATAYAAVEEFFAAHGPAIKAAFIAAWDAVEPIMREVFGTIRTVIVGIVDFVREHWEQIGPIVTSVLDLVKTGVGTALKAVAAIIRTVMAIIRGDWGAAWKGLKTLVSTWWNGIKSLFSASAKVVVSVLRAQWAALKSVGSAAMTALWDGIKSIWSSVKTWFSGLGGKIKDAIGDLGSLLWDVGKAIIQGLWDGAKELWDKVAGWFAGIGSKIKNAFKWMLGIGSPSSVFRGYGQDIMQGLILGLRDGLPTVSATMGSVSGALALAGTVRGSYNTYGGPAQGAASGVMVAHFHDCLFTSGEDAIYEMERAARRRARGRA